MENIDPSAYDGEKMEQEFDRIMRAIDRETPQLSRLADRKSDDLAQLQNGENRAVDQNVRLEEQINLSRAKCTALTELIGKVGKKDSTLVGRLADRQKPDLENNLNIGEGRGIAAICDALHRMSSALSARLDNMSAAGDKCRLEESARAALHAVAQQEIMLTQLNDTVTNLELQLTSVELDCKRLRSSDAFGPNLKLAMLRVAKVDVKAARKELMQGNMYLRTIPTLVLVDDQSTVVDGGAD